MFYLTLIGLLFLEGCSSLLKNTIKDTAGPSIPSQYFLSVQADPEEVSLASGQTDITIKVWDAQGKPVPGVSVHLNLELPNAGWLRQDVVVTDNEGLAKTVLKRTTTDGGIWRLLAKLENLEVVAYISFLPIK